MVSAGQLISAVLLMDPGEPDRLTLLPWSLTLCADSQNGE